MSVDVGRSRTRAIAFLGVGVPVSLSCDSVLARAALHERLSVGVSDGISLKLRLSGLS